METQKKEKKIGFLEKYNEKAGTIEKSSMNAQMLLAMVAAIAYIFCSMYFDSNLSEPTFITVLFALLSYSVAPKTITKLAKKE